MHSLGILLDQQQVAGGALNPRMAGVLMLLSGTIWSRTKVMPKWIVWLTFIIGVGLIKGDPRRSLFAPK